MAGTPGGNQGERKTPHLDERPESELTDEERAFRDRWDMEFGPQGNLSPGQRRLIGIVMIAAFIAVIVLAVATA